MKEELFQEELSRIQQRHALFFPIKALELVKVEAGPRLVFLDGYDLPDVITMEIEFAFKMVYEV